MTFDPLRLSDYNKRGGVEAESRYLYIAAGSDAREPPNRSGLLIDAEVSEYCVFVCVCVCVCVRVRVRACVRACACV